MRWEKLGADGGVKWFNGRIELLDAVRRMRLAFQLRER